MNGDEAGNHAMTWELAVTFAGESTSDANPAACKNAVLRWLATRGVHDIVESFVDGIETPLEAAFDGEGDDAAPILVYVTTAASGHSLAHDLTATFGDAVQVRLCALADEAWATAWQVDLTKLDTRRCLVVLGDEAPPAATDERVLVRLVRGEAFGDGRHATTQAILQALEDALEKLPGARVLDLGTGNGVLAVAALKLGARAVVATEMDHEALEEAAVNLQRNGFRLDGASRVVLHGTTDVPRSELFDIVAANILAPVLMELLPDMTAALAPGGTLLLAGFIAKEAEAITTKARSLGLSISAQKDVRGWLALSLERHNSDRWDQGQDQ